MRSNYGINKFIVEMAGKKASKLLFIGTASPNEIDENFWENGEVRYGWVNDLLNIHNFAYCPHYEERADCFDEMLKEKALVGLAMESDTAFVEQNGKIRYIKSNKLSNAYFLSYDNGKINKQEIEIQFVS